MARDSKKRGRGSRTHGGGSQKKRRGAGNRGGRGDAGRKKHESREHPPLGKHGFKRPQKVVEETETVNVGDLDRGIRGLVEDGVAEESGDGYTVDARDVVEDGHEVDLVKVLGAGQVYNELEIVADAFSADAEEALEAAGGEAVLSDRGEELEAEKDTTDEDDEDA